MSERSARKARLRRGDCCGDVRGGGRGRPIGSGWAERLARNGWGAAPVRAGHGQHREPPGESGRGGGPRARRAVAGAGSPLVSPPRAAALGVVGEKLGPGARAGP